MTPGGSPDGLVERIRLGDGAAEDALVDRFYERIYAIAVVRTRDREVSRDLAQEIMLAVLCALREGRLRDSSGLAGYVCATARNRINCFFRHRRIDREVDPQPALARDSHDPQRRFEDAERRALALRAIEQLSSDDRKILRLTLVEGLKPREIASRLGLKPEVVHKRRSRAVRRAREAIRAAGVTNSTAKLLIREELP